MTAWAPGTRRADVLVLTAIPLELTAVVETTCGAIPGSSWETLLDPTGLPISFRPFAARGGRPLRVAVTLSPNMGATAAIATLSRLLDELQPVCIAMCGVCAGRRGKTQLGDVVAADRLFYHDTGKRLPDDTQRDLTTYPLRSDWKVVLQTMDFAARFRDAEWFQARPSASSAEPCSAFRVHVAPLASGTQVIEDEAIWEDISKSVRSTLALDMEAAALGELAHRHRIDAVVMKGVMDFANHGRDDRFKGFAARASAECLLAFLREQLVTEHETGFDDLLTSGALAAPSYALPSSLLLARHQIVPWHEGGRSAILAELDAWADDPGCNVGVRLVHAAGGIGKTRLAIEWVRRRRERHDVAGFLIAGPDGRWLERLSGLGAPVLVIIDYAERRADLVALLERVAAYAAQPGPHARVRVLLLARSDGDWWHMLRFRSTAIFGLLEPVKSILLPALPVNARDRELMYHEAAAEFAKLRGRPALLRSPIPLEGDGFNRMLYLHMAALAAVEGAAITAAGNAGSLMDVILDHEERFWANEASVLHVVAVQLPLARQIMAAATLRGGLATEDDARELCARLTGRRSGSEDHAMLALLHHVYQRPGEATYLPGLEPDLLGEAMVLRVARPPRGAGAPAAVDWIERVFARGDDESGRARASADDEVALTTALVILGRASVTDADAVRPWITRLLRTELSTRAVLALRAAKTVGQRSVLSVLGDLLADELERSNSAVLAVDLDREGIPFPTVSLQRVAAWTTRQLHNTVLTGDNAAALSERSAVLAREGLEHDAAGHRRRALAATQDAVQLYRMLVNGGAREFRPLFARSLNNLGNCWSALGDRHAALSNLREAVELCRKLVAEQRDAFEPDLACSLNNLGVMRNALGLHDEALADQREAVDLHRVLAKRNPDTFRPELAMGLNNLGNQWEQLGKHDDALRATREAERLYRELAKRNPDAFQPDHARSLNNLGLRLSSLGRHRDAYTVTVRAVDLYRKLSDRNPDAFQAALANSLNNLGLRLRDLKQHDKALEATREAVDHYRALVAKNGAAFQAQLAMTLNNLGKQWGALGRTDAALAVTLEAVNLYRVITGVARAPGPAAPPYKGPPPATPELRRITAGLRKFDGLQHRLAESLTHLSSRLTDAGQHEAAIAATRDAVDLYRFLSIWKPAAFQPELARSLNHLGTILSSHDLPEALSITWEAVELCRTLVAKNADAYAADLATSLSNLGNRLCSAQNPARALAATREAVELYRKLSLRDPELFRHHLAASLNVLALRCSDSRQPREALEAVREAVEHYRGLVAQNPREFMTALVAALNNQGEILGELGDHPASLEVIHEAETLRRKLASRSSTPRLRVDRTLWM